MVKINVFYKSDYKSHEPSPKRKLGLTDIHQFIIFVCILVDSMSIGTITPSPLSPGTAATGKSIIVYYGLVDYFFS